MPPSPAMEQLNRSISKLKPPTKITTTASSSSTIATALAVAAAMGANENTITATSNNQLNNIPMKAPAATANTVNAGLKRKAEETGPIKRTRTALVNNSKQPPTNTAGLKRGPLANANNNGVTKSSKPSTTPTPRAPLTQTGRRGITSTTAASSNTTVARRAVTKHAAPTASKTRPPATGAPSRNQKSLVRNKTQQPSPSASASSNNSDSNTPNNATRGTSSASVATSSGFVAPVIPKKKKRPAWDTKGRLEDMEELTAILNAHLQTSNMNMEELTSKLESSESKIAQLESFRQNLESKVAVKENENRTILQKMQHAEQDLQSTTRQHEEEIRSLQMQHSIHMDQLKMTQTRLKQETEQLESKLRSKNSQLESQIQENTSLRSTISAQASNCLALESDNRALKTKFERTENTLENREMTIRTLEQKLADSRTLMKELEQRIRQEETIRRRLHNTIQELKGNIRVFCRVRPVTPSVHGTKNEAITASIKYPDMEGREIEFSHATETATGSQIEKAYPFTFDKVFQPLSTQEDVFEEISQLVQSALDGYNVCIFAYGQTGSGKTYTMEGPLNASKESMGMIPRSVLQIYDNAKALEAKGWTYTMEGQYVEIYNESINDLLSNDGLDGNKRHDIRHGPNGKTTITDITTVVLTSPEKVAALLKKAAHNRSVGSTQMNERSSRSHCVFTLRLAGKNSITDESSEGVLNLIDLAGSERLSQSGATGDRLKETQAINKSLSCLGDVIYAIANKDPHVPYRNSKLTYLLQNSLGGNSKTLMFVNISPLRSNFNETLCSLRFATKVNSCTIGTATKRAVVKS